MKPTPLFAKTILGPAIHFDAVGLVEGNLTILKDINAKFTSGGWHAVLGPNGGGKSTLLKAILGLTQHHGTIQIEWPQAESRPPTGFGSIGYLPQLLPFDASLPISVKDYLFMTISTKPAWFQRKLPHTVLNALTEVGLEGKVERKIGDLSGGERQRLMLCVALLQKPSLLILDEPLTGLDQQGRQEVLALLSKFHQSGGSIVMVEHDWQIVEQYCDHVYWVNKSLQVIDDFSVFMAKQSAHSLAYEPYLWGNQNG